MATNPTANPTVFGLDNAQWTAVSAIATALCSGEINDGVEAKREKKFRITVPPCRSLLHNPIAFQSKRDVLR